MTAGAPFEFEILDVPTPTAEQVRARLDQSHGCLVVGPMGSGKTHALRRAVNGAVWVNLTEGPLQQAAFFIDVACQVERGEQILAAAADQDLSRARALVDEALADRWLVVDRAEGLVDSARACNWSESVDSLWRSDLQPLFDWLVERLSRSPTVLASRRPLTKVPQDLAIDHRPPEEWPVKLSWAPGGFREWVELAGIVGARPAGLMLARALVPLLSASAFNELVQGLRQEDASAQDAITTLGQTIASHSSSSWGRVLGLVDGLDGAARDLVEEVLDEQDRPSLVALIRLGLVEEHAGRLVVQSTARSAGAMRATAEPERTAVFRLAARRLLDSVNDPASLDAGEARSVFCAHRLYVALGDFSNARKTARLHVAGLIDLARRTSLAGQNNEAREQYEQVLGLLSGTGAPAASSARRARSYVLHYRAYNGKLGGSLGAAEILQGYQEAARLWPQNALWHSRVIGQLIELGRSRDALEAICGAYRQVEEHPLRDSLLRITPAWTAMRAGAPVLALQICESIMDLSPDVDPEGAASLQALLGRWDQGCALCELPWSEGRLVFYEPQQARLTMAGGGWRARFVLLDAAGQGDGPLAAVEDLARTVGAEARGLVGTPTHLLDQAEVRRKARLIGALDLLNSDIGLRHATHRWLLGRVVAGRFHPVQDELEDSPLGPGLDASASAGGMYFARFPVYRDGLPSAPAERLVPAGSGRSLLELMQVLRSLPEGQDG